MMFDLSISWLAVLLAAIASGFVGWFWYNPKVFGTIWAESQGFNLNELKMESTDMVKEFVSSLVTAFVLALFYDWTGGNGIKDGLLIGFWAAIGFQATCMYSGVIWAKTPLKTYLINTGAALITLLVMGAVISLLS